VFSVEFDVVSVCEGVCGEAVVLEGGGRGWVCGIECCLGLVFAVDGGIG